MELYQSKFLIIKLSKNMKEMNFYAESGWDGVNFLHSSPYGAVVSICGQKLLKHQRFGCCWAAPQDQGWLCFSQCPHSSNKTHWGYVFSSFFFTLLPETVGGGIRRSGRRHIWGSWPQLTKGECYTISSSTVKAGGKGGRKRHLEW